MQITFPVFELQLVATCVCVCQTHPQEKIGSLNFLPIRNPIYGTEEILEVFENAVSHHNYI